jgi:hypothetical protein
VINGGRFKGEDEVKDGGVGGVGDGFNIFNE